MITLTLKSPPIKAKLYRAMVRGDNRVQFEPTTMLITWREHVIEQVAELGVAACLTGEYVLTIRAKQKAVNSNLIDIISPIRDALEFACLVGDASKIRDINADWQTNADGTIMRGDEVVVVAEEYEPQITNNVLIENIKLRDRVRELERFRNM